MEAMMTSRLMPLGEVADALGVSIYTVRRQIDAEAIKAVRVGARVLVCSDEVLRVQREGVGPARKRDAAANVPRVQSNAR